MLACVTRWRSLSSDSGCAVELVVEASTASCSKTPSRVASHSGQRSRIRHWLAGLGPVHRVDELPAAVEADVQRLGGRIGLPAPRAQGGGEVSNKFQVVQPIRIVIADDHPIFRDGLRRLLEAEPNLTVLGEASDGRGNEMARQLKPDILLLDLAMPSILGWKLCGTSSAGGGSSPVRVILLTAAAEKSQIVEALQLGARGVVLKDSATQLLLKAIQTVMAGEYWVGRESVSKPGAVFTDAGAIFQ